MITRIRDVTNCIQAVDNHRRRKVVHFNCLKLCGVHNPVDQQHGPSQTASPVPNTAVRRPHFPPPYVPDETDLMYMDKAANVEVAVPERPEQFQEPHAAINDQPVHADRPRREIRPPTWMRVFVS